MRYCITGLMYHDMVIYQKYYNVASLVCVYICVCIYILAMLHLVHTVVTIYVAVILQYLQQPSALVMDHRCIYANFLFCFPCMLSIPLPNNNYFHCVDDKKTFYNNNIIITRA